MSPVTFESERPVDYLNRLALSAPGSAYKAFAQAELNVKPGNVVADLGCGPGADLLAFSQATGEQGQVIGLDSDPEALAQAQQRTSETANVTLRITDAHELDLGTDEVDRLYADRVLQHVHNPARVLSEVARVLRPDGIAVLAEPDWDTLIIDHPNVSLATAYREFVVENAVRNARVGRQLQRLARQAGLRVTRVLPVTTVFLDAAEADRILGFRRVSERAVNAGYMDDASANEWLGHLQEADFFASVTLFITSCRSSADRDQ